LNVAIAGLNNWGLNVIEYGQRIPLCAELVTPIVMGPRVYKWVAQVFAGGGWYYYLTTGCGPGTVLDFLFVAFDARPFRPPYPVKPDS
jgi:hypothetical protein